MFKRGPSAQILLLVHLCIVTHFCNATPAKDGSTTTTKNAWTTKLDQIQENRFVTSDEESGILLPPDDQDNFVGQDDDDDPTTTESIWRTGRNSPKSSPYPPTTIVSTNSYSIRPSTNNDGGSSSSPSSSYTVNARPVPIVTSGSSYTVKNPYFSQDSNKSTVFVKNNCFGHRCPPELDNSNDEWKSYHYILNQGVKHNNHQNSKYQRKLLYNGDHPSRRHNDIDLRDGSSSGGLVHEMSLSIPFRVDPTISKYETSYPSKFNRRVLQTTPSSSSTSRSSSSTPGWVKLQPILPDRDQYDPFTLNKNNKSHPSKIRNNNNNNKPHKINNNNPSSQFANRLGVELDPDSFAERWGWGDRDHSHHSHHHHHGHKGGGGSRFPGWLQGGGEGVKGGSSSSDRDAENRNWVKLEPIPVAGVTISKWVPKGTSNHELPSTNWPSRDPVHSSNGIGHSNPTNQQQDPPPLLPSNTKWWDIIDSINRLNQNRHPLPPQYGSTHPHSSSSSYDDPPRGWSPNKHSIPSSATSGSLSSWERDRFPQNSWDDIIYPNGPNSATVSWQKDKQDMSKYGSSFPSTSGSPWQSDIIRRPPSSSSATGSWSADKDSYPGSSSYGGNRRQGSSSYPDKHTSDDDPRWVLVSNTKKVTVSSGNPNRHPSSYPPSDNVSVNKYRPDFDKFSDFPFYEPPYKNRRGKDYKDLVKVMNITVSKPARTSSILDQDAAFKKINATLNSLTPVLNRKRGDVFSEDIQESDSNTSTSFLSAPSSSSSSSSPPSKLPGFLQPYFGSGRQSSNTEATTVLLENNINKGRRGLKINPVYAAVGAGMVPATMAAIIPIMLGKRRRRRDIRLISTQGNKLDEVSKLDNFQYYVPESRMLHRFMEVAQPRRKRALLFGHLQHHKANEAFRTLKHFPSSHQDLTIP